MAVLRLAGIVILLFVCGACGTPLDTQYPNRSIGSGGQQFTLDELEDIANDTELSEEEKRQQFRDLGIEDEELIDALLQL